MIGLLQQENDGILFLRIKDMKSENIKICCCCGKRKVAGTCIINGTRRNLQLVCKQCFMRNPDDMFSTKRNKGNTQNYYKKD
jgi:hypothetical protein